MIESSPMRLLPCFVVEALKVSIPPLLFYKYEPLFFPVFLRNRFNLGQLDACSFRPFIQDTRHMIRIRTAPLSHF